MREARARITTTDPVIRLVYILVSFLLRNLWLIVRRGVASIPVWFRFEVFRKWIDYTLDELLRRK